jgi:hypothetical protein
VSRNGPVQILDAVPAPDTIVRLADGREFVDVTMALHAEDVERIRTGYVCIRCLEPQETPFPEVCGSTLPDGETRWCNFPMRERQAAEFEQMYKGEVNLDGNVNVNDEIERMREMDEYEQRTGLILPDHVKNRQGKL